MFKVKRRAYGKAADGRTVLLHPAGAIITDDEAKRAGLLKGKPKDEAPARGLTIKSDRADPPSDPPSAKPLDRMKLEELRAVCEAEGIDPLGANTRAEFTAVIEAGRAGSAE